MGDKLTKLSDRWLLIENNVVQGVISISHIDAIYSATKHSKSGLDATDLFLSGSQEPMRLDIPFADVLSIVTGTQADIDNPDD